MSKGIFRKRWEFFYTPIRKIPTAPTALPPDVSTTLVSRVHPSRNISLRDNTFRVVLWQYYSPKRVIYPALFVPGITNAPPIVHPSRNPRLRDATFRPPFLDYYQPKRVLYPSQFVPGITQVIPIIHPSRNPRLRDSTFRPPWLENYQPKHILPSSIFVPGVLLSKHPRQNVWDRETDYRFYRFKRVLPPSIFVPGIIVLISKVHPSRNIRLRDETFRPPFRNYYKPKYLYLNVTPFVGGIPDAMFKRMYKGMFKRMEPH